MKSGGFRKAFTVAGDPLGAVVSGVVRAYEEAGFKECLILTSERTYELARKALSLLEELKRSWGELFNLSEVEVGIDKERLGDHRARARGGLIFDVVDELLRGEDALVVLATGSRAAAAALTKAAYGLKRSMVYVGFTFGLWDRLYYPFTPRASQPVKWIVGERPREG